MINPYAMNNMSYPAGTPVNQGSSMGQYSPMGMSNAITSPMAQQPQTFKKGGRVKKSKLTAAHMSPHELDILDELQGGREVHNTSGARSYSHLEELLKNPHLRALIHQHAANTPHHEIPNHREHHAGGGLTRDSVNAMKAHGVHGDSEVALIGPHTHHFFNTMVPHPSYNKMDGHPQYFNLGKAIGGIGKSIVGGVKKAGTAVGKGIVTGANKVNEFAHSQGVKDFGKGFVSGLEKVGNGVIATGDFLNKSGIAPILEAGAMAVAPEFAIPAVAAGNAAFYGAKKAKQAADAARQIHGAVKNMQSNPTNVQNMIRNGSTVLNQGQQLHQTVNGN